MLAKPIEIAPFVKLLDENSVRYVVIGGIAMMLHGSAHVTQDVDFAVARDSKNLSSLAVALAPLHPKLRGISEDVPFMLDERMLKNTANLTIDTDWGALDILGDVSGVKSFDELWQNSVTLELEGVQVRVASLEDLIRMKRAANRLKDQNHLLELESLLRLKQLS